MQKSQAEKDSAKIYIGAGLVGTSAAEKNMMLMTKNWWHGHGQGQATDTHWQYIQGDFFSLVPPLKALSTDKLI